MCLVGAAGLEPARPKPKDFLTIYGFRRRRSAFVVWTFPSPWAVAFRCCPSSLYTFPVPGLARDWHQRDLEAFPDFEQFYSRRFRQGTHSRKSFVFTGFTTRPNRHRRHTPQTSKTVLSVLQSVPFFKGLFYRGPLRFSAVFLRGHVHFMSLMATENAAAAVLIAALPEPGAVYRPIARDSSM